MATALSGPYGTPGVKGSIGQVTLTQGRRGQTVLKSKPMPTNPNTDAQYGNRAMFGWTAKQWRELSAEDQLSYHTAALAAQTADFAQFAKANADRWQNGKYPSMNSDAAELHAATASGSFAITKGVGVPDLIAFTLTAAATDWGVAIFRKNGGSPSGTRAELWDVLLLTTGAHTYNIETMGEVGDQWGAIVFSHDGKQSAIEVEARPA